MNAGVLPARVFSRPLGGRHAPSEVCLPLALLLPLFFAVDVREIEAILDLRESSLETHEASHHGDRLRQKQPKERGRGVNPLGPNLHCSLPLRLYLSSTRPLRPPG